MNKKKSQPKKSRKANKIQKNVKRKALILKKKLKKAYNTKSNSQSVDTKKSTATKKGSKTNTTKTTKKKSNVVKAKFMLLIASFLAIFEKRKAKKTKAKTQNAASKATKKKSSGIKVKFKLVFASFLSIFKRKKKTKNKKVKNEVPKKRSDKYKKKKSKKKIVFLILKVLVTLFILGLIFVAIVLGYFFISKTGEVNDKNFWQVKQSTNIYDRDENLIYSFGSTSNYVELDQISEYYLQGLIATEDEKFETHKGVNLTGMVRATIQTLFTDSESGGSTLTMQLAKNLYLMGTIKQDKDGNPIYTEEGYLEREYPYNTKIGYKLQQMVYAWKIEKNYTKKEILENYVNSLYFSNAVGIQNASQYYFGVNAKDLNLSQSATLAGMTQLPEDYNPYKHIEAATSRRDIVLGRMLEVGYITQEEYDSAKNEKIEDTLVTHDDSEEAAVYDIIRPYLDVVENELVEIFGDNFTFSSSNIDVYTTLDYNIQEETYKIINDYYGNIYYQDDVIQAGSTTVDSQNGEILAIGGGRTIDDKYPSQNFGAFYQRQPGSTSKPLVDYGPALEYLGWSTYHQMTDKEISYTGGSAVKNSYDGYLGEMSIQEALSRSSNTVALQTFQQVALSIGVEGITQFMESLGLTDTASVNEAYSIGGWDNGTTPLELSGAYAAFANGGTYNKPHAIRKIVIPETSKYYKEFGSEYEYEYEQHKAMSESTAYMMMKMLNPYHSYSITDFIGSGLEDEAIKTGTSNWDENTNGIPEGMPRDKWTAGYNADVTTIVWSGYTGEDETKGYYYDNYGYWCGNIYKYIMQYINSLDDEYLHDNKLEMPSDVYSSKVGSTTYYFKKGTTDASEVEKLKEEEEKKAAEEAKAKEEKATASEADEIAKVIEEMNKDKEETEDTTTEEDTTTTF